MVYWKVLEKLKTAAESGSMRASSWKTKEPLTNVGAKVGEEVGAAVGT